MSRGSTADRALVSLLENAAKLDNKRFKNLGDATLRKIATRARGETSLAAGSAQRLASRATRELEARKKKRKK